MVLTQLQTTAFIENPDQLGIPHETMVQIQREGIQAVADLADFEKQELQQLADNLRKPGGRIPDPNPNAAPGATIPTQKKLGKNIGQQYCWCSLMWLMPLRSLSNCDYELNFYLRLILGPIHSNQVMGTDPVGSHHGTRNSRSNSINPTYPYQSHD